MKKQNQINKLAFNKNAVLELNDNSLSEVNGGSTPACVVLVVYAAGASSVGCVAVGGAIVGSLIAWAID